MSRLTILSGMALLVILASIVWWLGDRETERAEAPVSRASVTVNGAGIMDSAPVSLSGDYRVDWTASSESGGNCYHSVSLRTLDDRRAATIIAVSVPGTGTGTAYVYALDAGRYFLGANSGCTWSFTFVPQ